MKNSLEDKIKSVFDNYEEEYNHADWIALEKKLNGIGKFGKIAKGFLYSALAIGACGLIFNFLQNNTENNQLSSEETIVSQEKNIIPAINEKIVAGSVQPSLSASTNPVEKKVLHPAERIMSSAGSNNPIAKVKVVSSIAITPSSKSVLEVTPELKNQQKEGNIPPAEVRSSPSPKAAFRSDKNIICANSQVQFFAENSDVPCEYRWDFGDGEYSNETNPKHLFKTAGVYSLKLQAVSLIDKKSDVQTMIDMITVNPVPVSDFIWKAQQESSEISFEASQEDIVEWKWDFGDKQYSQEPKTSHFYNKKGNYTVSLIMKNNFGCTSTTQKTISVISDFNLFAPNSFTPNGDGKNDTWLPTGLMNGEYVFSLTILDKNGYVAFKTASATNPWDGRHAKTNDMIKTGDAFKWIAVVRDKNGTESTYGGDIFISGSTGN